MREVDLRIARAKKRESSGPGCRGALWRALGPSASPAGRGSARRASWCRFIRKGRAGGRAHDTTRSGRRGARGNTHPFQKPFPHPYPPQIHGGLLGVRGNSKHEEEAKAHGVAWIDIVVVNLYAFEATVAKVRKY